MDKQSLIDSIAYCGLVCGLCHLSAECDFCKSTANLCDRADVCHQRKCCIEKQLNGCWECSEFPCGKDMFAPPFDLRIRAFVSFIKDRGADELIECLMRNQANGIHYGLGKDYDGKTSEQEVFHLLKTGLST